jgi:hypothetical protein
VLQQISQHLRNKLKVFSLTDNLIFNNKVIEIKPENYFAIPETESSKTIAFIDGGQAELISGGNLNLSFIRIFAQVIRDNKKVSQQKYEFYVLTTATYKQGDIWYEGKIFQIEGDTLVSENDLSISSNDTTIKTGSERAPISKVTNMARRFAELKLAKEVDADYVLLDGTLAPTYKNEENYLAELGNNVSALAKTCSLFTTSGNSPTVLLQKLSEHATWRYFVDDKSYFVKLHEKAKHIFRFEGNKDVLPLLMHNSADALFLGYPYGLILADQMARVSNSEKNSLRMSILLRDENREIVDYLSAMNAHEILDSLG